MKALITYTNYRGVTSDRIIIPMGMAFLSNQWHPQRQWMVMAWDCKKQAMRSFPQAGISKWVNLDPEEYPIEDGEPTKFGFENPFESPEKAAEMGLVAPTKSDGSVPEADKVKQVKQAPQKPVPPAPKRPMR